MGAGLRNKRNKKIKSNLKCLLMIAFTGLNSVLLAEGQESQKSVLYANQKSSLDRLNFTVELMTNGTIRRTMPLDDIKGIFGDHLVKVSQLKDEQELWTVRFEPIPEAKESDYVMGFRGWYVRFEIDKYKKLRNYYISNMHK
jgi:DNA-directed RNA polymerase alpha subunit